MCTTWGKAKVTPKIECFVDLITLLYRSIEQGASDLHCSSNEPPVARVCGALRRLEDAYIPSRQDLEDEVAKLIPDELKTRLSGIEELDCAVEIPCLARLRVHVYQTIQGLSVAIRVIPNEVPQLDSLGLPAFVNEIAKLDRGLVLVSGPTGSGKSTTLAAIIDQINRQSSRHIITIEDPIEYRHSSKHSLIRQREVGEHTRSFAAALRAALREDPDVILVGELRDLEVIQLALTAAETGHLILSTLHASGVISTIDRFINAFPSDGRSQARAMLADCLEIVLSQRLIVQSGGELRPDVEILTGTAAVRSLIRDGKTHQLTGIMQASRAAGMCTFGARAIHG
jgi:twitching motility protein PilT